MANKYEKVSDSGRGIIADKDTASDKSKLQTDANFRESELNRANTVIADRTAAGLDVSNQQAYIDKIGGINASIPKAEDPYQRIIDLTVKQNQDQIAANTAAQKAGYKSNVAGINKTYEQSVAEQEGFKGKAEEQYTENLDTVDANRYREREQSRVSGEQRGIGSSAQFDALNRGTTSRAGQAKIKAATSRDRVLNDISQRISGLRTQQGLDVTQAGAQRDINIATGTANANATMANQQIGIEQGKLAREQSLADIQSQREYGTSERVASEGFQTETQVKNQTFQRETLGLSQEFQREMTALGFDHDITMFDKQSSLSKYLQAANANASLALADKNFNNSKALTEYNHARDVQIQLAQADPRTPEGKAMRGAIAMETKKLELRAQNDFEWAKKYAEFESINEAEQYKIDLDRSLASFEEGSDEWTLQKNINDRALANQTSEIQNGLLAEVTADAFMAPFFQGGEEASGFAKWNSKTKENWNKFINVELFSGKSDESVANELVELGKILNSQENIDQKATYDSMKAAGYISDEIYDRVIGTLKKY